MHPATNAVTHLPRCISGPSADRYVVGKQGGVAICWDCAVVVVHCGWACCCELAGVVIFDVAFTDTFQAVLFVSNQVLNWCILC